MRFLVLIDAVWEVFAPQRSRRDVAIRSSGVKHGPLSIVCQQTGLTEDLKLNVLLIDLPLRSPWT